MSEESHKPESDEPEYGPTYYAPVEMPMPRLPRPPFWMIALALIMVVITWLPLAIIAQARVSTFERAAHSDHAGHGHSARSSASRRPIRCSRTIAQCGRKMPGTVARRIAGTGKGRQLLSWLRAAERRQREVDAWSSPTVCRHSTSTPDA